METGSMLGVVWGRKFCEEIGINPKEVTKLNILVEPNALVTVDVTVRPSTELGNLMLDSLPKFIGNIQVRKGDFDTPRMSIAG